jgi:hypothetical protein
MKAKDLRGKNIEEIEEGEEDAVTAAYENISKKLDSIRNGKDDEDSDSPKKSDTDEELEEPELEEWKGPKKPEIKDIELEEEEIDIRKVKLHNLEDPDEDETEDEEIVKPKKEWEPKENDPLDEEDASDEPDLKADSGVDDDLDEEEVPEKKNDLDLDDDSQNPRTAVPDLETSEMDSEIDASETKRDPQPDTLDDLAQVRGGRPMDGGSEDDDEYYIPSLKRPGQEGGNLSYNTPPQREEVGQSYSPKGNYMDGNDPNNFFSQHSQPQPPKRASKFHLLILVIIGIAVIGFTVYILKGGFGEISITSQPSPSPSATATPEPTPTATPEPQVERGNFTVKVLNGTTTSGLAGKVRDKLKELGYKTSTPGNNSDTDVAQTEIRVKEGTESAQLFERLKLDLAPDYDAKQGDNLDKKSANDAEVVIGAK